MEKRRVAGSFLASLCLSALALLPAAAAFAPRAAAAPGPPGQALRRGGLGTHVVAPTRAASGSVVAIRAAVHVATSEDEWSPFAGAKVVATLLARGRTVAAQAITGADGNADLHLQLPNIPRGVYRLRVETVTADRREVHEGKLQVVTGGRVLITSDKPIYQAGQTIHFRALALRSIDLRPVVGVDATFEVEDPRGNLVLRQNAVLSRFGVASGELKLAEQAATGSYRLRALIRLPGGDAEVRDERVVKVARYTPPKFQVTITPDRPFERPGSLASGLIEARHFFGKPLADGAISLEARLHRDGRYRYTDFVKGQTDKSGRYRYQVRVGRDGTAIEIFARVRDAAGHESTATRAIPVAAAPFHVEVMAEGGDLIPGVENQVFVTAVAPDGAPVRGARVEGWGRVARTDEVGVATITVHPKRSKQTRLPLELTVVAANGDRVAHHSRLSILEVPADRPAVLLRPERVLLAAGAPLAAEVFSSDVAAYAYVDVIKEGQTLRSAAAPVTAGRARFVLPVDDTVFGTVTLRAEVVDGRGGRSHHERLVHVDRQRALRVEVSSNKQVYAPGGRAVLHFRTVDAQTGIGAPAQIGVVMVDDAVLALTPVRSGMERVYFTLAREAQEPRRMLKHAPGGYTVERLLAERDRLELRDRVARVLLAGAVPAPAGFWQTDPWEARRQAWARQVPRLTKAVLRHMQKHSSGTAKDGFWGFRDDLFAAMVAAGTITTAESLDPWLRTASPARVAAVDAEFRFPAYADQVVKDKLRRAYRQLAAGSAGFGREKVAGRTRGEGPFVWSQPDARRLVAAADLVDPWGNEMRVVLGARYLYAFYGSFLSRHVLTSAGPDGRFGTKDDVQPEGDAYVPPQPGQKIVSRRCGAAKCGGYGWGYGRGMGGIGTRRAGTPDVIPGSAAVRPAVHPDRVRQRFPETLLWKPDLLTDPKGAATLGVELADSITTWRLQAVANAEDGRIGTAELGVRVFQEFFVDLDLPRRLTQGDEITVPVVVHNYQQHPARVSLALENAPWFTRLADATQVLDLGAGETGVRGFRVRAVTPGRHALTVRARGGAMTDAVRRPVEVTPDGAVFEISHSGRVHGRGATQDVLLPDDALPGTTRLAVKVLPGVASQILHGLDGLIEKPSGCFEQTSSTTYPNVLILDYLRRTRTGRPETRARAAAYLGLGYQRLLSFEVKGGGFSLFGEAPADVVLSAYGLDEFTDMARVRFVDWRVIERTRYWLLGQQRDDGAFVTGDEKDLHRRVRTTAYVALSLARTGYRGPALQRALTFLRTKIDTVDDPYALALVADLLAHVRGHDLGRVLDRLWRAARVDAQGLSFEPKTNTVTGGQGRSGRIETTALVAEALFAAGRGQGRADQVLGHLLASKDSSGAWGSTQATVLTLRALRAAMGTGASAQGELAVKVDGTAAGTVKLDQLSSDVMHEIDLSRFARPGSRRVELKLNGRGAPMYQVVARGYRPHRAAAPAAAGLGLAVEYSNPQPRRGDTVVATVKLEAPPGRSIHMPVIELGLAPGFEIDEEALARQVQSGKLARFEHHADRLVLYLLVLESSSPFKIGIDMKATMAMRAQVPASVAYAYYDPDTRAETPPVSVVVQPQ
jgi:hypothetical protein